MEAPLLRTGCRHALKARQVSGRGGNLPRQQRRWLATPTEAQEPIRAAQPIQFSRNRDQFAQRRSRFNDDGSGDRRILEQVRVVPASPSYFTATPRYTDDLLRLTALIQRFQRLPQCPPGEAPRIAWKSYDQYKAEVNEPVKQTRFSRLLGMIKRLNNIHGSLVPDAVHEALQKYKRAMQPFLDKKKPVVVDQWGRARAVGRRKSSHAQCYLVEGEGEVRINGRSLTEYFGRIHDRESAVWALKASGRLDKYNVWVVVEGGGLTGQAEAITLGVARALLVHEPDLKPALRRAGCLTRDPRRVERKKPGKLKARKMPAWVKR